MTVEKNITLFAGAAPDYAHPVKNNGEQGQENKERKTVFAGDFQGNKTLRERIQQRKAQAQQEALKIVQDAWTGDKAFDQTIEESREHIREIQEDNLQAHTELNKIKQQRQELMETYGVTEDTPKEEWPEEYRDRMKELDDYAEHNEDILRKNDREVMVENAVIRGTKAERMKKHLMTDARKQAEEVLEAASDEIVGMVMEEAKDHLDEEQEKREEQAEKIEEKKEEMEELLEKREERQEELEELIESIPVEKMLELDQAKLNIQQEVQNIVNKMKLVAEDIKGAMVDKNV